MPAREARYATTTKPLPSEIDAALKRAGVTKLYSHQAETIDLLRDKRHTVIATGTASGKTVAYHVPVFESVLDGGVALYLSPTKALAQDQLRQVERFGLEDVRADTYDGDTPQSARASIRRRANVVLTNPDMLHFAVLPHHELWRAFLGKLTYVVVDEAHVLRGIFG